ncbi:hypothetical protein M3Y97_00567600 [Aphelenchoides bicaudatus]|nr:hypothetical protein M3Y97_00567600 [Aphelenchoides bicaudatus]
MFVVYFWFDFHMIFPRVSAPSNAFMADVIRFVPHFQKLKLSWTSYAPMSAGMEKFVDEYLPKIQENNPQIQVALHRACTLHDPFVVGVFEFNRMKRHRCCWKTAEQILAIVEEISVGGDFRSGRKRGVSKRVPRGLLLLNTETMGHDVFEVYSKYKGDPPHRDAIRSAEHKYYTHKIQL